MEYDINFIGVILAAASAMVVGSVWYSPKLFGNAWMRSIGKDPQNPEHVSKMRDGAPKAMGISVLMSVITAYVLNLLILMSGSATLLESLKIGLLAWVGLIAAIMLTHAVYEGKKFQYFLIQAGYQLVVIAAMSLILGAFI